MEDEIIVTDSTSTLSLLDLSLSPTQLLSSHLPLLPLSDKSRDGFGQGSPAVLGGNHSIYAITTPLEGLDAAECTPITQSNITTEAIVTSLGIDVEEEIVDIDGRSIPIGDAITSIHVNDLEVSGDVTSLIIDEEEGLMVEDEASVEVNDYLEELIDAEELGFETTTLHEVGAGNDIESIFVEDLGMDAVEEELELTEIEIEVDEELVPKSSAVIDSTMGRLDSDYDDQDAIEDELVEAEEDSIGKFRSDHLSSND